MPQETEGAGASPVAGYALATAAAACWAASGVTAKWLFSGGAAGPLDPAVLAGARSVVAAAVLLVFLALARPGLLRVRPRDLPFLAAYGVFGLAAVHFAYFKTISLAGVATAILLEYLAPVFVLAVSVLSGGRRMTWALPAGVGLSVAGCALVAGAADGSVVLAPAALAWGLASAVLFAGYALAGRAATVRWHPLTLLGYGLAAAALFWLAVLGPQRVLAPLADPVTAAAVLFVAVFGTVLPFAAFLAALRRLDATRVTVTSTLEPVLAAGAAWLLLGEALTAWQLAGGVLVLAAVLVASRAGAPAGVPGA